MYKISFKKVSSKGLPLDIKLDKDCLFLNENETVQLRGKLTRLDNGLFKLDSNFSAYLELVCSRSGDIFYKNIESDLILLFSDGLWKYQSQTDNDILDVIEFFDGFIDLAYSIESEVQSIKLDYIIKE